MISKTVSRAVAAALLLTSASLVQAEVVHPTRLSAAEVGPGIFSRPDTVISERSTALGTLLTRDLEAFRSADGHFDAGIYAAEGEHRFEVDEGYSVYEFMYFLDGGVTVTSIDGTVTTVTAGEALMIPKGWQGTWHSEGYTKIYVIYSPDQPIE